MEMRIKCVNDEGKACGMVHIHKVIGTDLKKIGEIKYNDESDRKWIVTALTERHPNVSVIE
jgi:transcriptional regulator of NAD metabolism